MIGTSAALDDAQAGDVDAGRAAGPPAGLRRGAGRAAGLRRRRASAASGSRSRSATRCPNDTCRSAGAMMQTALRRGRGARHRDRPGPGPPGDGLQGPALPGGIRQRAGHAVVGRHRRRSPSRCGAASSRFLTRRASFTSQYRSAPEDLVGAEADAKRRSVERGIVSLIEADGIEQRAVGVRHRGADPVRVGGQCPTGRSAESAYAEQRARAGAVHAAGAVPLPVHRAAPARGGGSGRACTEHPVGAGRDGEGEDIPRRRRAALRIRSSA